MQKLVSRNPVQRFKEGRKIFKAQGGSSTGGWTPQDYYSNVYDFSGSVVGPTNVRNTPTPAKKTAPVVTNRATSAQAAAQGAYNRQVIAGLRNPIEDATPVWQRRVLVQETPIPAVETPKASTPKPAAKPTPRVGKRTPSPVFYGTKAGGQVTNGLGSITPEQKAKLISTGQFTDADFASTKSLQTALNKYFAADNAGSIKVDNLWGNQTQKAFNLALAKADTPQIAGGSAPNPTVFTAPQAPTITPAQLPKINVQTPARTFNRSEIRQYMRDKGVNPYSFTGDQRKALRMVMNGQGTDDDKAIVQGMGLFKKGGILPSRNPVVRFKQRNFR